VHGPKYTVVSHGFTWVESTSVDRMQSTLALNNIAVAGGGRQGANTQTCMHMLIM
jgi:hypothetical protein